MFHSYPLTNQMAQPGDFLVLWQETRILLENDERIFSLPRIGDFSRLDSAPTLLGLGGFCNTPVWTQIAKQEWVPPTSHRFQEIRPLLGQLAPEEFQLVSAARTLLHWDSKSQFCGQCGSPMQTHSTERAKQCPQCQYMQYPQLSPAIIVAITDSQNRLLLAHNKNYQSSMNSVLAGFSEAGESLEQTVEREVWEEVRLRVENIRYVASQPWAFPNSLMIAFSARALHTDFQVDGKEIESAQWYTPDQLPNMPSTGTIARKLIDDWLNGSQ